ncbi:MAG: ABC transporter permease [Hespellia sp.]|nr:ABC transporter permease [Hespellia sp.]
MLHLIKYRFLQMIRFRTSMFWALAFPLILGTFFYIAFGNTDSDTREAIPVAVVEQSGAEEQTYFKEFLKEMDGDTLKVSYLSEENAKKAMKKEEINGIYDIGEDLSLTVDKSGISASILQSLLASYERQSEMITDIAKDHPEKIETLLASLSDGVVSHTKEVSIGAATLDTDTSFFFALIAMACMYGCFLGLYNPMTTQANLSAVGARKSMGAKSKLLVIISDMLVVEAIHFVNVCILLLYLHFVLKMNFGAHIGYILLICLLGSLIGVCLGILIGSIGKMSEGAKIGIMLTISMISSGLSGLFADALKTSTEGVIPWIAKVNPATLIADSFYYLTVYDDINRYRQNMMILAGISVVMLVISFLAVRRERYESI